MVQPDAVVAVIRQALPDATVDVEDLTGGGDHLQVTVVSSGFSGLSKIKQTLIGLLTFRLGRGHQTHHLNQHWNGHLGLILTSE